MHSPYRGDAVRGLDSPVFIDAASTPISEGMNITVFWLGPFLGPCRVELTARGSKPGLRAEGGGVQRGAGRDEKYPDLAKLCQARRAG